MPLFKRQPKKQKTQVMKHMRKMLKAIRKNKKMPEFQVSTRQEIITELFTKQVHLIGMEPSAYSGHLPLSHTPLAQFLREHGLPEDVIEAVSAGIMEEESEENVRLIIEAAFDTPEIQLSDDDIARAKELAVEEWQRRKSLFE